MKNLILLLASTVACTYAARKPKQSIYQQCVPSPFNTPALLHIVQTPSGDMMQLGECKDNGLTYGVINIRPKNVFAKVEEATDVICTFMQSLQPCFGIKHTTDYVTDNTLNERERKVTAYWQDCDNSDWKVEGWTNGAAFSVAYVNNIAALPVALEEKILAHFRFVGA